VKLGTGAAVTVSDTLVVAVRLPDVPVIVIVAGPVVAVLLAVNASVLLVALVGLKEAVTPDGTPDAENATLPLNPFCGATVTVLVPVPPCTTLTLLGEADSVKLGTGAALTVRDTLVVAVKLPDVPVMVIVAGPVVAVLLAVNVNVLVDVALVELNVAVTPFGTPVAERATVPLKPFSGDTVTVVLPLAPPCVTVTLAGDADSVKFGVEGGGVVTETLSNVAVVSAVVLPLVTARPTYTVGFIVMLRPLDSCTQFTPSFDT